MISVAGNNSTQTVSATAANVSTTLNATNKRAPALSLLNVGSNVVYVRVSTDAQAATTADLPIGVNERVILGKPLPFGAQEVTLAAICAATQTATLHVTGVYVDQ